MSPKMNGVKTSRNPQQVAELGRCEEKLKRGPEPNEDAEGSTEARLDAQLQAHLGKKLKAVYQALVDEPVPDKFHKLLDELESKERKA